MNWIEDLYVTYDHCKANVGYAEEGTRRPLLPICHITTQAHIEIAIDGDGKFLRARVITDKADAVTIVPSTEASASRAGSKPENHPLCDKLQYVAGDYTKYGGTVTSGYSKKPEEPYQKYIETLNDWCESKYAHAKARAVLEYVKKKTVVKDLVKHQILLVGTNGNFLTKADVKRGKEAKDIFTAVDPQTNAFVRWVVEIPNESESCVWKDKTLWESWIGYYLGEREAKSLCIVTGKKQITTNNHPKYIRREGDGAKLISANDTTGFTFLGRFTQDEQACSVGLEASHKAHYALLWLISRQGYRKGDLAIVAWATSGAPVPQLMDDASSLLWGDAPTEEDRRAHTAQELAVRLKNRIRGYGKHIGDTTDIVVLSLDAATTGRLAITYYRRLTGSDFLRRIDAWHESCAWLHHYRYTSYDDEKSAKRKRRYLRFVGAPAPADIAEAAYGSTLDAKLLKATITRLLPCIVDGQPIPRDVVESVVRRASNRIGIRNPDDKRYYGDEEYTWKKTLSIACALFKKSRQGREDFSMALDPKRETRDYLYGRLLALAESLEEWALDEAGEDRPTNAARLMQRFSEHPYSTWRTIEMALAPYKARLGGKSNKRQRMIDEVVAAFKENDFINDRRLSGEFLLAYHSQREFMRAGHHQAVNDLSNSESIEESHNEETLP